MQNAETKEEKKSKTWVSEGESVQTLMERIVLPAERSKNLLLLYTCLLIFDSPGQVSISQSASQCTANCTASVFVL